MRTRRRWIVLGLAPLVLAVVPLALWASLKHRPRFYRERVTLAPAQRHAEARRFVRESLQLRNDIHHEPRWQAAFSDQEVNAWLAEDLVTHFADQLPPGIHDPMVAFEMDRVMLAFEMDEGPFRSVITIAGRVQVPEGNVVALTLEKIHAGAIPLPLSKFIPKITEQAERRGLEITWRDDNGQPTALIRYRPDPRKNSIVLERVQILDGQIRLAGRSVRESGRTASLSLPRRKVLQSTFPIRKDQRPASGPVSLLRSTANPSS